MDEMKDILEDHETELKKHNLQLRDIFAHKITNGLCEVINDSSGGAAIGIKKTQTNNERIELHQQIYKNIDELIKFLRK